MLDGLTRVLWSVLLVVGLAGSARAEDRIVHDQRRWTYDQVERYWSGFKPPVRVMVAQLGSSDPDLRKPHEASKAEKDHTKFLVQKNITTQGEIRGGADTFVVAIEPNPGNLKVARVPLVRSKDFDNWLDLTNGTKFSLRDVIRDEKDAFCLDKNYAGPHYFPKYKERNTWEHHRAFPLDEPVYEGGSVGVIVDGDSYTVVYVGAGILGLALAGYGLLRLRKRN